MTELVIAARIAYFGIRTLRTFTGNYFGRCLQYTRISIKHPNINSQVRFYAKCKDKKKDKKTKVEINEQQLREIINYEALNTQMQKVVLQMKENFISNLSLRSTTGALETLRVNVDGEFHELQQIAQVSRKNPKVVIVNMIGFPQMIPSVLKAIEKSGMNLNPQQDGTTLFIPIPKVTREHRELLSKNAKSLFIKYRNAIKDIQNNAIKKVKGKDISKDEIYSVQNQVTAIADKYVAEASKLLQFKEKELLGNS